MLAPLSLENIAFAVGTFLENPAILQMKDFQFGWYMKLLFQLAKSGGYLPLDCSLGTLAGAHSGQYWEANAGPVLACFKVQERVGRKYIFSDNVLKQLSHSGGCEDGQRVPSPHTPLLPKEGFTNEDVQLSKQIQTLFEKAYKSYPRHVGVRAAEKAFLSAVKRISRQRKINPLEAGTFLAHMAEVYASTPAGQRGKHTPHMSTWLNEDRFADDPAEWNRTEEKQNAIQKRLAHNLQVIEQTFAEVGHGDDDGDAAEMAAARA